jgi:hypothetical protein
MSLILDNAIKAVIASKHSSCHWLNAQDEFVKDDYYGDLLVLTEAPDGTFQKFILVHDEDIDGFFDYFVLPMTLQSCEIRKR